MCWFGIPRVLILDNSIQFYANNFKIFYQDLHIQQKFTLVEHLQTNRLVKSNNQTILEGLKKRLDLAKGGWVQELPCLLWLYRIIAHTNTRETAFRLTYRNETMILVEINQALEQVLNFLEEDNS